MELNFSLLLFALGCFVDGNPEASGNPSANASASASPSSKTKVSADPQVIIPPRLSFSGTPFSPFAHSRFNGVLLQPTPLPRFSHLNGKISHHTSSHFSSNHPGSVTFPPSRIGPSLSLPLYSYKEAFHLSPGPIHAPIGPPPPPSPPPSFSPGNPPSLCSSEPPPAPPRCSQNTTKPWCTTDFDYPNKDIQHAIQSHKRAILSLYADVADLSADISVARPSVLHHETNLCPSETSYTRVLRAVNTQGTWRTIVNNVQVEYDVFTQTTRLEECLTYGKTCALVPSCYNSKCTQKSVYHRFLVYDPCDSVFPFAIEAFKLPASCSCIVGEQLLRY